MNKLGKALCGVGGLLATAGIGAVLAHKEPAKYSMEWIRKLSDADWETEREIIRQKFCNPKYSDTARIGFEKLLNLFDKVKSDRDWAGKIPKGPSYHREHGFNLFKPD